MASKCSTVTICGKRRKICRNAKGKITSNKPVGGGGGKKKSGAKKRKSTKSAGKWVTVSREAAVAKSGAKKGKLKKGCKFTKSGAKCRKKA